MLLKVDVAVKASELTRLAKKHGCRIKRHGSEHDIWINPKTGSTARIPRHQSKEIATGTAQNILRALGLKG
jgi:predicted RNA binding protein YcfA (HicA-like mRNA interferase family)